MSDSMTECESDLIVYRLFVEKPGKSIREAFEVLLCKDGTPVDQKNEGRLDKETKKAAQEEAARIRWLLAINPNTPPPVLEHLSRDNSANLLQRVAEHPRAHVTTLARLSVHPEPQVRASVAENPSISIKTVWRLVRDECADVRLRLAESYTVPVAVLRVLCDDDNPFVSQRAQQTIRRIMGEVHSLRTQS